MTFSLFICKMEGIVTFLMDCFRVTNNMCKSSDIFQHSWHLINKSYRCNHHRFHHHGQQGEKPWAECGEGKGVVSGQG